jgi:CRISPR/Cas system-associated endonuclease Cas1
VFDLLEPLRAKVDVWALELISKKGLRPYMFHELRDGVVRLDPDLAKLLAQSLMPKMRGPAMELASQYVTQLRKIKLPYRLQRAQSAQRSAFRKPFRILPLNLFA